MPRKVPEIPIPTPEQLEFAEDNLDPLSFVSSQEKERYRGMKIAVLVDGDPKQRGKVIAVGRDHQQVRAQVEAAKEYAEMEWALCEVPP